MADAKPITIFPTPHAAAAPTVAAPTARPLVANTTGHINTQTGEPAEPTVTDETGGLVSSDTGAPPTSVVMEANGVTKTTW